MPFSETNFARSGRRDPRCGSALIIAVIFSMIIMFGLTGLLPMLVNDWKASAQISTQEAAFTLAESAVDEAIWAVLEYADDDEAWTNNGWTDGGNYWHRQWTLSGISSGLGEDFELDEGRSGTYRVLVQKVDEQVINIVSQGIVSGGKNVRSGEIARIIETQFRRPNPLGYGLIARNTLDFNGRPTFDSYHSGEGEANPTTNAGTRTNATVGSVSRDLEQLDIGNALIYGDLATGATNNGTNPSCGATVTGDIIWDFEMDFPDVKTPDTTGWDTSI